MYLSAAGKTDVGKARSHNEDFTLHDVELGVFVVCDGMGGHAAGEVASENAAKAVVDYVRNHRARVEAFDSSDARVADLRSLVREAVEHANAVVHELSKQPGKHGMGCTCVTLLVAGGKGFMGHVGDSRLYMLRDQIMYQLSEDHTYLNEALRNGMMTAEQAAASPYAHMITRGVGIQSSVSVDTMVWDAIPGDTYLLCSDGLCNYFEDRRGLMSYLQIEDLAEIPTALVDRANELGGGDNITALVVRISAEAGTGDLARASEVSANINTLRYIGLFIEFDQTELVKVLNVFQNAVYAPGEVVIREGDSSESLFVIVEGQLEVIRGGKRIAVLDAGSHFGEMALLSRRPRSATVQATQECRLLMLDRPSFDDMLTHMPGVSVKFLWKLAQILSLRLDELYLVRDQGDGERRTMRMDMLSPFRKGRV